MVYIVIIRIRSITHLLELSVCDTTSSQDEHQLRTRSKSTDIYTF